MGECDPADTSTCVQAILCVRVAVCSSRRTTASAGACSAAERGLWPQLSSSQRSSAVWVVWWLCCCAAVLLHTLAAASASKRKWDARAPAGASVYVWCPCCWCVGTCMWWCVLCSLPDEHKEGIWSSFSTREQAFYSKVPVKVVLASGMLSAGAPEGAAVWHASSRPHSTAQ